MKWTWLAIWMLCHASLLAQSPMLEYIGVEQGLSQGFVSRLIQDREGFIWMGTPGTGLNRFDGHRFQHYAANPFNPYAISGNFIFDIADLGDFLFVGTLWDGANLFHKKTGRFFHLPFDKNPAQTPSKAVQYGADLPAATSYFIARAADGGLWIRSHRHPEGTFWLTHMVFPPGFWERLPKGSPSEVEQWLAQIKTVNWPMQNIFANLLEDEKTMCRIINDQLMVWQGNEWHPLPAPAAFSKKLIASIPEKIDPKANYWWTVDGEIWRSSGNGSTWQQVGVAPPGTYVIQLEEGFAWVRADNRYQAFPLELSPFRIDFSNPIWSVETSDIRYIHLLDASGNVWFVNGTEGVNKFNPRTAVFHTGHTEDVCFYAPFLTTPEGVLLFSNDKGRGVVIDGAPKEQVAFIQSSFDRKDMGGGIVRSDGKSRVWIGGREYLVLADLGTKTTKSYKLPYAAGQPPCAFLVENDGTLQLPVGGALIHLDPFADTAISLDFRHEGLDALHVYAITKTGDGSIWLATDDGLLRIFPEPGDRLRSDRMRVSKLPQPREISVFKAKTRLYRTEPANRNSLRNNLTVCLLTDPADAYVLWIGTKGGGLNRYDLRNEKFTHLTIEEGLPDNVIYGILPDRAGHLWLSSNKGLIRYHPVSGEIKSYRKADGLQDDEFNP